jgi:hypothetical protein
MYYILVFLFQFIYNILKVEEIKFAYENKTIKLVINAILLNTLTILSTYYSLHLLLEGDMFIIISFITGGAVGKWFATTNIFNYRTFILDKIKKIEENKKESSNSDTN